MVETTTQPKSNYAEEIFIGRKCVAVMVSNGERHVYTGVLIQITDQSYILNTIKGELVCMPRAATMLEAEKIDGNNVRTY